MLYKQYQNKSIVEYNHCHCSLISLPLLLASIFWIKRERERERGTCWSVCRVRQGSILAFSKRGSHTSPIDFVFQSKVFHTFFSCFIFIGWVWVFLLVGWLENVALYWPNNAIKCNILIPKDSCILCKLQFLIATTIIIIIKKYFFFKNTKRLGSYLILNQDCWVK